MKKQTKLIALCGPAGVGKSTHAEKLSADCDGVIYSFASVLKEMLSILVGRKPIYDDKDAPISWLPEWNGRRLMQRLGGDWGRELIDNDLWVKSMEHRLACSYAPFKIIDDLRYPNEAEMVKRLGGEVWLCKREGVEYSLEHSSETPLPDELISGVFEL
jgi:hypothetical protein